MVAVTVRLAVCTAVAEAVCVLVRVEDGVIRLVAVFVMVPLTVLVGVAADDRVLEPVLVCVPETDGVLLDVPA